MVRRGLIVCYYFPPSGGGGVQRWVKFIKYLSRSDWQFTVITAPLEPMIPEDPGLLAELPAGTQILRTPASTGRRGPMSLLRRHLSRGYWQRWLSALFYATDSRKSWNRHARQILEKELNRTRYDCLIISSPPYALARLAADLTEKRRIPVVLDLRDPWTTNPYKIYPSRLHRYLDRRREQKCIGKIDHLISVYDGTFDYFSQTIKAFERKTRVVIPNGYDEDDFIAPEENGKISGNGFNLAFSGTFYSHLNRPDKLFAAIGLLNQEGLRINFHHFGQSMIDLHKLADKYGIDRQLHVWGYLEHRRVIGKLKLMDAFCLILDPDFPNADKTAGGKLFEYLNFRKPVLAVVPEHGEAARIINTTDCGLVVGSNDPVIIADRLKYLLSSKAKFSYKNIEAYSRKNLAIRLEQFLAEIILDIRA